MLCSCSITAHKAYGFDTFQNCGAIIDLHIEMRSFARIAGVIVKSDSQVEDTFELGDELFAKFYAALDEINFFKTSPAGAEDPGLLSKATQYFDDALLAMQKLGKKRASLVDIAESFKSRGMWKKHKIYENVPPPPPRVDVYHQESSPMKMLPVNVYHHHHQESTLTGNSVATAGEKLGVERFELSLIYISLSRKEKDDDFLAMKGTKLPQRPKKQAKNVDKTLQVLNTWPEIDLILYF
uniref:Uncharacterized protein n=1 Tax=Zea mays TaxID=4577 RepID=A0A804MUF7_MAIZE